jgi:hypothetical protein
VKWVFLTVLTIAAAGLAAFAIYAFGIRGDDDSEKGRARAEVWAHRLAPGQPMTLTKVGRYLWRVQFGGSRGAPGSSCYLLDVQSTSLNKSSVSGC